MIIWFDWAFGVGIGYCWRFVVLDFVTDLFVGLLVCCLLHDVARLGRSFVLLLLDFDCEFIVACRCSGSSFDLVCDLIVLLACLLLFVFVWMTYVYLLRLNLICCYVIRCCGVFVLVWCGLCCSFVGWLLLYWLCSVDFGVLLTVFADFMLGFCWVYRLLFVCYVYLWIHLCLLDGISIA